MARLLALLLFFASCQSGAASFFSSRPAPDYRKFLLATTWFIVASTLPLQNTSDISESNFTATTPPLLTTPYFSYVSIWIGNVCALFDLIGWTLDWVASGWAYKKEDTEEVALLKKQLKAVHQRYQGSRQEEKEGAIDLCREIKQRIINGLASTPQEKQCIIADINKVKLALTGGEIDASDGDEETSAEDA